MADFCARCGQQRLLSLGPYCFSCAIERAEERQLQQRQTAAAEMAAKAQVLAADAQMEVAAATISEIRERRARELRELEEALAEAVHKLPEHVQSKCRLSELADDALLSEIAWLAETCSALKPAEWVRVGAITTTDRARITYYRLRKILVPHILSWWKRRDTFDPPPHSMLQTLAQSFLYTDYSAFDILVNDLPRTVRKINDEIADKQSRIAKNAAKIEEKKEEIAAKEKAAKREEVESELGSEGYGFLGCGGCSLFIALAAIIGAAVGASGADKDVLVGGIFWGLIGTPLMVVGILKQKAVAAAKRNKEKWNEMVERRIAELLQEKEDLEKELAQFERTADCMKEQIDGLSDRRRLAYQEMLEKLIDPNMCSLLK